jgi:hypothetical protein
MGVNQVSPITNMAPVRFGPQECVGENTNVTSTNVIASANIKLSNPLTLGNGTDVTGNNISDLVAI